MRGIRSEKETELVQLSWTGRHGERVEGFVYAGVWWWLQDEVEGRLER